MLGLDLGLVTEFKLKYKVRVGAMLDLGLVTEFKLKY